MDTFVALLIFIALIAGALALVFTWTGNLILLIFAALMLWNIGDLFKTPGT